jgi:hypothetical protein
MGTFSLLGSDAIQLGGQNITDFGAGEVGKVTYPSELATVKTGKNGNTIYVQNASGFQATLELKVIRGGKDDKALNTFLKNYRENPTAFVLKDAVISKKIGDGSGNVTADTYTLTGGVPTKQVEVTVNTEGDIEQAISSYTWVFSVSERSL